MLVSQVLMVFNVIRKHDGLDLEGIADKINELHSDTTAGQFLTHGGDYSMLRSRISELSCIEERDGMYYFCSRSEKYSSDDLLDKFIRSFVEAARHKR